MSEKPPYGRFVWYDLMTTVPDATPAFYCPVTGWGTRAWEGGGMPYMMWTVEGNGIGGVMELPEDARKGGAPPHWLAYAGVADVDAAVANATSIGGSALLPGMDVPGAGRFAILQDPQGGVFAVYSSASEQPAAEFAPRLGDFSWHELATTDVAAAFGFYETLLGWEKTDSFDMGPTGLYQMFGRDGVPWGGIYAAPAEQPGPAGWLYYVRVADVVAAAAKVTEHGGQLLRGPMDVPGGDRVAQCLDPQGVAFALHQTAGS